MDWNRGNYNEAPASYFSMMTDLALSFLVNISEEEIWDDTQVLRFLQTHKYGCVLRGPDLPEGAVLQVDRE